MRNLRDQREAAAGVVYPFAEQTCTGTEQSPVNGKGCACAQAQTVRQTTAAGEHLHVTVVMVHMNLAIHVSADCTWPRTKTQAVRLRKTPAARGEPLHSTVVVVVMHQDHLWPTYRFWCIGKRRPSSSIRWSRVVGLSAGFCYQRARRLPSPWPRGLPAGAGMQGLG